MKPGKGVIVLLRFTYIIFLGVITNAKTLEPTMHFHLNESFSEFLNNYNDIGNLELGTVSLH